ncbi:MAG: lipoyl(octanoyl) transferase LipB [Dehalococcoidia bacterium]|nr:lipoyl(octanoyl) transferase LipB [Dehalococcoidia bacterium]
MRTNIEVDRLGTVSYEAGLEWQRAAVEAVRDGGTERVAVLEHEPVYTLGARASRASLRVAEDDLPAPLVLASRGGDVTFHGPGQLVVYPILDLRARGLRPGDYVRTLEGGVIEALRTFGIEGERWAGRSGVWLRLEASDVVPEKIAAIGVRVERGVSSHGLALNVTTDLGWYEPIVPCGIADAGVTSMVRALGDPPAAPPLEAVADALIEALGRAFGARLVEAKELVHG